MIFGVAVSLIEMLQGKLKALDLENILKVGSQTGCHGEQTGHTRPVVT